MAEGFAKQLLPTDWQVASAGIERHGVNPLAVAAMAEVGIDISGQTSKVIDPDYLRQCRVVVTLCGDARDRCPVVPTSVKKLHWPLIDPAAATGDPTAQRLVFRQVRDAIQQRVAELAVTLKSEV